ncbi:MULTISPECIES: 3-hydroxyisobutyrate dehydrogenase [Kordiimonas]|jgi:3-hydroxyisobutyrate dehydrogenase|uniref:3-hydroxyisobutyrate dehydrogenase n=1 Tax=Kordiimonas lacus TaxID=637679 RepID=A0A1G7F419_9PROT|nr:MULTISPECIES: 3-hydroxyisobutyrate dehydrogenase [Kordiimonas]SDE70295.1 3-hydroxyisobutyrate dehydrogenase [Kordiimonas lacus]
MTTVAFIGLGNMGLPMAKNLVSGGMTVRGFDLSADAKAGLQEAGGQAFDSVHDAVEGADVVITMLPNAKIVEAVYADVTKAAKDGALFIDSSTIDVATARKVADRAHHAGFEMVDAPVSGGVGGAAAGTLAFMVGGSAEAFERAKPVLEPMAGKIVHCGQAGNGQAAKACNNMLLAISMIGVSEAFNLGRALGLDDQTFFDVASNASGQCWSLTSYCPAPGPVPTAPSNNDYNPGFATALMLKDLGIAMDAAGDTGASTPLGALSREIYKAMDEAGHGGKDFSAVIKHLAGKL